jgi:DNA-binding winged helix-turn-helix (wHTH) protein
MAVRFRLGAARLIFGEFVLDPRTRQLLRGKAELHVERKAYELLAFLLERRPEAVSKASLRERLWPDALVSEWSLPGLVAQVRRTLEDSSRQPRFIRTVHRFGYAFVGTVSEAPWPAIGEAIDQDRQTTARLLWEERVLPLAEGANLIGRGPEATVVVDMPGISRTHARILVQDDQATLEDLGSKNGTYLHERRLEAAARLRDGDTFRLGVQLFVFRHSSRTSSTQSEIRSRKGLGSRS